TSQLPPTPPLFPYTTLFRSHLEQNLVKRHRPPFNVRLRDDKSFPYIAVTVEDEYPRVMFTRERHRRGVLYFGPYANAKKVRETLDRKSTRLNSSHVEISYAV